MEPMFHFENAKECKCQFYAYLVSHRYLEIRVETDPGEYMYIICEGVAFISGPTDWRGAEFFEVLGTPKMDLLDSLPNLDYIPKEYKEYKEKHYQLYVTKYPNFKDLPSTVKIVCKSISLSDTSYSLRLLRGY